jgi:uracil-DNA glycosylase
MDRHEAILRELNMYPLWVRREQSNSVRPELVEGQECEPAVSIQTSTSSARTETNKPAAIIPESNPVNLNWPELKSTVHSCQACALRAGCTQPVFGTGDESADWLFVGDAPDADDDAQGEPFAGQAGKLLDNMLMAIKLKRHNVYLTHAIKCRPLDDRHPHVGEIAQCLPYLQRQIALIQPKVIVALGKVASNALLGNDATLASLRGTPHDYQGIPLIVTYHPSYLLRSPMEKAKAWQDLCMAVALMQKQS